MFIRLGDKVNTLFALITLCSVSVILPRGKNLTTPSVWFRESISQNGILFIRKIFDIGRKEGKFLSKSRSTCNLSCNDTLLANDHADDGTQTQRQRKPYKKCGTLEMHKALSAEDEMIEVVRSRKGKCQWDAGKGRRR